ncbi:ABC transporter substrate-binding protein [Hydrogenophaga sp. RWCD_12]|uniref:ABC transporter substrate-binding protein n=1 Tax=Hydrogenophaga sp. RWCD_12 TaxID=3391190 RepID=UPI0039849301
MNPVRILGALLTALFLALAGSARAQTLVIESWRTEDKAIWEQRIIPAFQRQHPGITIKFAPTARELYDQTLSTRLDNHIAGDLIACRPFDASLALFLRGHLMAIDDLKNLAHFPPASRIAWQTDDGRQTFCMPIASVMHGIFYNKAIFRRLGLSVPPDQAAWFALMQRVAQAPGVAPLALGTADRWESHQLLFTSIGPSHWGGEAGRRRLLRGEIGLTDPGFIGAWETLSRLADFLPRGYASMGYEDAMELFGQGLAAMRPGGSWEIASLQAYRPLELGVFPPPVLHAGRPCQVSDHLDIGMGINPRSQHLQAARTFLDWLGSAEFTQLYANAAVGFYPLADHPVTLADPLAREMMGWRQRCQTTVRLNAQRLNRGEPDMEDAFWTVNAMVVNRRLTPEQAARRLQRELARRQGTQPLPQ